jgi:hypothetical protein
LRIVGLLAALLLLPTLAHAPSNFAIGADDPQGDQIPANPTPICADSSTDITWLAFATDGARLESRMSVVDASGTFTTGAAACVGPAVPFPLGFRSWTATVSIWGNDVTAVRFYVEPGRGSPYFGCTELVFADRTSRRECGEGAAGFDAASEWTASLPLAGSLGGRAYDLGGATATSGAGHALTSQFVTFHDRVAVDGSLFL